MDAYAQNNANGNNQVHAMVLGFNNDTTESQVHGYPEALPANVLAVPQAPAAATSEDASEKPKAKQLDNDASLKSQSADQPPAAAPSQPSSDRSTPRDFSTSICDFPMSWPICFDAYCCTYCLASAHHNYLVNEQEGVYVPLCCGLLCMDMGLAAISSYLPSTVYFHTCFMRHALRQRYNLHHVKKNEDGSVSGTVEGSSRYTCNSESMLDFLTVCFCLPCSLAQHQREILLQGDWCGGVLSDRHSLDVPDTVHTV